MEQSMTRMTTEIIQIEFMGFGNSFEFPKSVGFCMTIEKPVDRNQKLDLRVLYDNRKKP